MNHARILIATNVDFKAGRLRAFAAREEHLGWGHLVRASPTHTAVLFRREPHAIAAYHTIYFNHTSTLITYIIFKLTLPTPPKRPCEAGKASTFLSRSKRRQSPAFEEVFLLLIHSFHRRLQTRARDNLTQHSAG